MFPQALRFEEDLMPAKSFIGELEDAARRFYATAMRGEVSDANVRGYLRAASQITDIWQQIDDRLASLINKSPTATEAMTTSATATGEPAWSAYAKLGYALAFIRAARAYQVFLQELLTADAAADPATAGYLPRVTFDQANALAHQIQPNLQRAVAALTDPTYEPDIALPIALGPRIEAESACPAAHLEGMIAAAREIREWAAGLIAEYVEAVHGAAPTPATVEAHITALNSGLAQADEQLRFGTDLVGQVTQGQATPELHEQAEDNLWDAMQGYFLLNQVVALPDLLTQSKAPSRANKGKRGANGSAPHYYSDKRIRPDDLWRVAAPSARSELRGTEFGQDEMQEMSEKMGGVLSAGAQQYLDEVEEAVRQKDAVMTGAMANCPFEPLYRSRRALNIAGAHIPANHEFHWNFHRGHLESAVRFDRVNDWQECEE